MMNRSILRDDTPWDIGDDDKLHEECGVFGVIGANDAAAICALGLHALQHRGQEAVGITSFDGKRILFPAAALAMSRRTSPPAKRWPNCPGTWRRAMCAIRPPAVRGCATSSRSMPIWPRGGFAIAHNGNISNAMTPARRNWCSKGAIFQSTSDTEVIIHLVATSRYPTLLDRFVDALRMVEGAYSLICMTPEGMIACRDPLGIRPLVMGKIGDAIVFASETVALDVVGAEFVREVEPGELVQVDFDGNIETHRPFGNPTPRPCIFEHVYFSRPDSIFDGRSVYAVRKEIGVQLALESPVEADLVVPVPDSGVPAAIGYSAAIRHSVRTGHHPLALCRADLHPAFGRRAPCRASSASTTPTARSWKASGSC